MLHPDALTAVIATEQLTTSVNTISTGRTDPGSRTIPQLWPFSMLPPHGLRVVPLTLTENNDNIND